MKNKILLHAELIKKLEKEFDTSNQTVRMSLYHVFQSDKAKKIRMRAKELLQEQALQITD